MTKTVDYYFATVSPWTYLGHSRFVKMVRDTGATVRVKPMDLGTVFPASGGLPLAKRAPQRQAYRLVELKRFSEWLGIALNPQPLFFPVAGDDAARLIIAAGHTHSIDVALNLAGRIGAAIWAEERNVADPAVLRAVLDEAGVGQALMDRAAEPAIVRQYLANTREALDAGVFGAPSYVIDGEIFWGQDRLDFVERRLRC